jgi:GT2 family glycosyltransferase
MAELELSIIIPVYKKWHLASRRLWEIQEHCLSDLPKMEVILVDDCSKEQEVDKGLKFWSRFDNLSVFFIQNEENVGFGASVNRGAMISVGKHVVVLSTDVQMSANVLMETVRVLKNNPNTIVGNRLLNYDTGWNTFNGRIYSYLEGYYLGCSKTAWNDIGGFDERYGKFDYEDVDFSTTAIEKGYSLIALNSPALIHVGGMTIYSIYGVEGRRQQTEKNREEFKNKWINCG